jgi:hypothetical protein
VDDDSEASRLMDDGHLLGFAGCDLPAATQKAGLSGFLDNPSVVDCEMQIEEFRWRCWAPAGTSSGDAWLDRLERR